MKSSESFESFKISPIYQYIRQFELGVDSLGAPDEFSFEHFLPWIHQIMLVYQKQEDNDNDDFAPKISNSSNFYYTRKVN